MESNGRFTPALRRLAHYSHDHCASCGKSLPQGTPAYAGYDANGKEVYVGDCCADRVAELASHMYWWWTNYRRPVPETVLWRYMDFAKFVAMLNSGGFYFARADKLGDPFEGARGLASRKAEWTDFTLNYYREALRTLPGRIGPPDEAYVEREAARLNAEFERMGEEDVRSTFVSCWHANDGESEAQWRLYAPGSSSGLAVRTKFGMLDQSLDQSVDVKAGYVRYVDFAKVFAGSYDRVFWKRASLSHENEVRAVVGPLNEQTQDEGLIVKANLTAGIDAVVVSPYAPPWFDDLVRDTLNRFGVSIAVEKSSLLAVPFY